VTEKALYEDLTNAIEQATLGDMLLDLVINNSEYTLQFVKELINAYDQVLRYTEDEEKKLNNRIIVL